MSEEYPKKIVITAYLENGEVIRGQAITLRNANEEAHWANVLRKPKEMAYLGLSEVNAFGDEDSIYINPNFITHIRLAFVKE